MGGLCLGGSGQSGSGTGGTGKQCRPRRSRAPRPGLLPRCPAACAPARPLPQALEGGPHRRRADPDARRRIIFANVGEQEKHEQRAAPRRNVNAPGRVVAAGGIAGFAGEADVNVLPKIARVSQGREAYDERAHIGAAVPTSPSAGAGRGCSCFPHSIWSLQ
jgi:hypothetical protein